MSDIKIITQAQLLTTTRDLRDRVEISLHKLGPGAKAIQTNLNNIVATLSVQNAHPVDDKQPDLFGGERVGLPQRKSLAKSSKTRHFELSGRRFKPTGNSTIKRAKSTELSAKNRKSIDKITTDVNCSKCNSAFPKTKMNRTSGHRWICTSCKSKADKQDWRNHIQGKGKYKPTTAKSATKKATKKAAKRIKPQAAFMAPYTTDVPELLAIIGKKPQPRTEITNKLWDYIKKHGLQDKKNRRNINCDASLSAIFRKKNGAAPKQVSMFEMTKLVAAKLKLYKEPKSAPVKTKAVKRTSKPRKVLATSIVANQGDPALETK